MTHEQNKKPASDRSSPSRGPRRLEVVKDMTDTQHTIGIDAEQGRSVQEISHLFDIAGREGEVIAGLAGGMDDLRAVQAAKQALARLSPAEVRDALAYRRTLQPGLLSQPGARLAGEPS
ncbi:hypothetical protein ABKW28_19435 [Nocardioides sp. 31GB23]|uniref:hypothetical protein n=1 Tax=Nocardioides sp. 31GB23 TaxID=3156065 RepID=UPI0032AFECDB